MRCTTCGTESTTNRKFCAACGSPLARRCPKCGAENAPSSAFCEDCGTALAVKAAPAATGSPQAASTAPEIAGALGRDDHELDRLLAENGKASVNHIIGRIQFEG